jgi:PPK2 family polyphosphate:nucleotide phosphotransferase
VNYSKQFLVKPGARIKFRDIDPDFMATFKHKDEAKAKLAQNAKQLRALQEMFYAEHKRSLLICLQAMDTGGKDGTISHVLGAMNPQGCHVTAFKEPSAEEHNHDFFWRAHKAAPSKGEIAIFNRSHYEDVLVARVHHLVPKSVWQHRYEQINAMEKYLAQNDTLILKFFLYISKDEQLRRFKDRLDDPAKHWKISEADYKEREHWEAYMHAFEDALSHCSTKHAPWFIIPANHKWFRDLAISQIIIDTLTGLDMKYPSPAVNLKEIRKQYNQASKKA